MKLPANVSPADPLAALVAVLVGILGTLGLWTKWGLTADQVAEVGASVLCVAAILRAWLTAKATPT